MLLVSASEMPAGTQYIRLGITIYQVAMASTWGLTRLIGAEIWKVDQEACC
jgi:hypothetical protein